MKFKEILAKEIYGLTLAEAKEKEICIACKNKIKEIGFVTPLDEREYEMTGLCRLCFEKI